MPQAHTRLALAKLRPNWRKMRPPLLAGACSTLTACMLLCAAAPLGYAQSTPASAASAGSAPIPATSTGNAPASATSASNAPASDQTARLVPPGFLFFYDADGDVTVQKGGKVIPAPMRQTLEVDQPISVTLKANAIVAVTFSNGTALWGKGPGNFTVTRFQQQPFQGNSRQDSYEPTSSTLDIDIAEGAYAFAERQLSALSALRLHFGGHVLDAHETPSFLVDVGANGTEDRISVINGRALLHYHGQRGSAVLLGSGQFLKLEGNRNAGNRQLRLPEQLTTTQQEIDIHQAARAQIANDRIWFIREPGSAAAIAQPVVPVNFWLSKPHAATRIR